MKEKIIARLKALLLASGVNLSSARIDAIADKLSTKITDENQIDARLNELNEISPFSEIAKYEDWQRAKEAKDKTEKEAKEKAEREKAEKEKDKKDQPGEKDTPEWAKGFMQTQQTLMQKIEALESGKKAENHSSQLLTILKEKKVPESYYGVAISGRTFKDDADVTSFANTLTESWGKFHQDQVNDGLKDQPAPIIGSGKDPKNDVSPDMQEFLANKKELAKKQPA